VNAYDWLPEFAAGFDTGRSVLSEESCATLGPGRMYTVAAADWDSCIQHAARAGLRWAGLWVDPVENGFDCTTCLARGGDYLFMRTRLAAAAPELASHTPYYPAADRMERHAHDLMGVRFSNHPDTRRWTRHQAWPEDRFPLLTALPTAGDPPHTTPPDMDYPFVPVQGAGVEEIPVGPVHAGIIEPGHFRFQAVGEDILRLEERLGYVHKGIEKIAVGRDPRALARLAGRVSGDTTVAHAWAACMAMEQAAGVTVPARANRLRAVLLECERVANHLGDIGAICNDVAFTFAYFQFSRMRERWLRGHGRVFGHRLLMDRVIPGGVSTDMDDAGAGALREGVAALRRDLLGILPILDDHPSLEDRLIGTGVLPRDAADRLGALGYVGRASGMDRDVRRDTPHAPYDEITVKVPVLSGGDVAARLKIRIEEIHAALVLVEQCLAALPGGDIQVPWPAHGAGEGVGIVEGWRGETLAYVRFDGAGRIARYFPRDPSWFSWPALEELIKGNIVPEFPVCNKSVNASYSGHDL
jgi:Ni,Fe-hydrogenase III large subunit